jgi:hypothetical protein
MSVEIDVPVVICATRKKSVTEVERYEDENGNTILVETLWRNGEFQITPASEYEVNYINENLGDKDGSEFDINTFIEWEMQGTFDGCSMDFRGDTEKIEEAQEDDDFYYHTWLEENGYEHVDTEYYIYNGIELVE